MAPANLQSSEGGERLIERGKDLGA